jgi:hypothetical protein
MKRMAAAGYVTIGIAVWLGAQAPLGDLPPVDYSLGPDSQPHPDVPKGTVTRHVLVPGKFFPGTPHNYQIFVPDQYDPGRPIPYMIFLDGGGYAGDAVRVPVVLDNLIARREVPPMMAIFIDPGVMPALSDQAQNRYERIFEYDSLTPRFANFLIDELFAEIVPRRELVAPASGPPRPVDVAQGRQGGAGRGTAPPSGASAQAAGAAAPAAGRGSGPRGAVYGLIYPDRLWEQVGGTYESAASPAMDKDGNVYFADPASNRIYKSDAARMVTVFKENTGGAGRFALAPMAVCTHHSPPAGALCRTAPLATRRSSPETSGPMISCSPEAELSILSIRRRRPSAPSTRRVSDASPITAARS